MSGHYDDRALLNFIEKSADKEQMLAIDMHLESCTYCYTNYLELVKHQHDRTEVPDESFVKAVLNQLESKNVTKPKVSLRAAFESAKIRFYDSLNNLLDPVPIAAAQHALSGEAAGSAVAVSVGNVSVVLQLHRDPSGYRVSISGPSSDLSITCYRNGSELETIRLADENAFQTIMQPAEYVFSIHNEEDVLGNVRLTLE